MIIFIYNCILQIQDTVLQYTNSAIEMTQNAVRTTKDISRSSWIKIQKRGKTRTLACMPEKISKTSCTDRATATARTSRLNKPVFQVGVKVNKQNVNHRETRALKDPIVTSKCGHRTHPSTG